MSVTTYSGSFIAQPGQQVSLSSLFTVGAGLPATIGVAILDDDNYTAGNPGNLGHFSGNGATSQVSVTTDQNKIYTYELFQYDAGKGDYYNSTLGSLNDLTYTAPTGSDHAELLTIFSFKNGTGFDYDNLTDLGDLSVVTQSGFVNPFPAAMPGQATPDEISALADSFVGKVWNDAACQLLGNVIAGLAGSSLPFTAVALISANSSPILAQPNGEWVVAYDGRTQADPSYAAVEAMIRPGDIVNLAWQKTAGSAGHLFTVVSGSGADALVVDNEATGSNGANDGSRSDIIIQAPHSLDETLNQYFIDGGGAVAASIEVYRLDTPVIAAQASQPALFAQSSLALGGLVSAADPAGKPVVAYQLYDSAAGNVFSINGVQQTAHSAATAITVESLGAAALVGGTASGSDILEVRAFNGTYWGDWQALSVADAPALTAAQAIGDAAAGQISSGAVVVDSALNVGASLDGLATLAAKGGLAAITLTDAGIPNLTLTLAQFSADSAALKAISSPHTATVLMTGDAGTHDFTTDKFAGASALQFADQTVIVAAAPGGSGALTTGNITQLYAAVLGREPDIAGLAFYQGYLQKNPATPLLQFADWFLSSPEYTGNSAHDYAASSAGDAQFITDSYRNLLHRTPAADEIAFYQTYVMSPAEAGLTPGSQAFATAQFQAHALMLVYFSASPEFLTDVQITAQQGASPQHWLLLT